MPDPWTHAARLSEAVGRDGVAGARVAREDYEGARPLVAEFWEGRRWSRSAFEEVHWQGLTLVPAQTLLGYLRGHFLYREIPEDDRVFWRHFLEDLGLPGRDLPTQKEYDRLWEVLKGHPETQAHLRYHPSGDRDFIGTLDSIFHFRALRLKALEKAFYQYCREGKLPPEAGPYERLLQRLKEAIERLLALDQPPDLRSPEAVLRALEETGLGLGEPNPIRLLFHRSEEALERMYWKLKGTRPKASSPRRHPQVQVRILEKPPLLDLEVIPVLQEEPLVEGRRAYGQVRLEDGRFRRFSWTPAYTPEGEMQPAEVELDFREGEKVRLRLEHQAWGIRFNQAEWTVGETLGFRTLGFEPEEKRLRFFLASGGEPKERPEGLIPESFSEEEDLLVEVEWRRGDAWSAWYRIGAIKARFEPRLEAWTEPTGLWVRTLPPGLTVEVRVSAGRYRQELFISPGPKGKLAVPIALFPQEVELRVGGKAERFYLEAKGWPKAWWKTGLGFGVYSSPWTRKPS